MHLLRGSLRFATILLAMFSFLRADPLEVGADAPVVTATAETGQPINLGDVYSANNYTLVFFYPKAFTGGCTAQSCSLRDGYEQLAAKGVAIVGVSTDDVETQKRFKDEHRLPYTLIADTEKTVMKAFGQAAIRPLAARQAYLVKAGKIVYADHQGSTKNQADDILKFLASEPL